MVRRQTIIIPARGRIRKFERVTVGKKTKVVRGGRGRAQRVREAEAALQAEIARETAIKVQAQARAKAVQEVAKQARIREKERATQKALALETSQQASERQRRVLAVQEAERARGARVSRGAELREVLGVKEPTVTQKIVRAARREVPVFVEARERIRAAKGAFEEAGPVTKRVAPVVLGIGAGLIPTTVGGVAFTAVTLGAGVFVRGGVLAVGLGVGKVVAKPGVRAVVAKAASRIPKPVKLLVRTAPKGLGLGLQAGIAGVVGLEVAAAPTAFERGAVIGKAARDIGAFGVGFGVAPKIVPATRRLLGGARPDVLIRTSTPPILISPAKPVVSRVPLVKPGRPAGLLTSTERLQRFAARQQVTLISRTPIKAFARPKPPPRRPGVPQRLRGFDIEGRGKVGVEPRLDFLEITTPRTKRLDFIDPTTGKPLFFEFGVPKRPVKKLKRPTKRPTERPPTDTGLVSLQILKPSVARRTLLPKGILRPEITAKQARARLDKSLKRLAGLGRRQAAREQAELGFRQLFDQRPKARVRVRPPRQQLEKEAKQAQRRRVVLQRQAQAAVIPKRQIATAALLFGRIPRIAARQRVARGVSLATLQREDVSKAVSAVLAAPKQRPIPKLKAPTVPALISLTGAAPAPTVPLLAPVTPPPRLRPRIPRIAPRVPTKKPPKVLVPRPKLRVSPPTKGRGFIPLVREKGGKRFFAVTKQALPFNKARNFAADIVDKSTAASFKLKRSKKRVKAKDTFRFNLKNKFRMPAPRSPLAGKGVLVEKNKNRIDSPGERQGITAKGLLALRKKRAAQKLTGVKPKRRRSRRTMPQGLLGSLRNLGL